MQLPTIISLFMFDYDKNAIIHQTFRFDLKIYDLKLLKFCVYERKT